MAKRLVWGMMGQEGSYPGSNWPIWPSKGGDDKVKTPNLWEETKKHYGFDDAQTAVYLYARGQLPKEKEKFLPPAGSEARVRAWLSARARIEAKRAQGGPR